MSIENWVEIKNCKGYFISDLGRVTGRRGGTLKLQKGKRNGGYWIFRMPHMKYTKTVHRIVAEHFVDNPKGLSEVNHLFGDKDDNRACSLEWTTRKNNMEHASIMGLRVNTGWRRIFNDTTFQIIKDCFNKGFTNVSIARYFNCHHSTIAGIRNGKRGCYSI